MTEQETQAPEQITLGDAIKDLGWFSWLFAIVVAGPSILSILQAVFVEHRLIAAFQWIVDGYNAIVSVLGAVIEPLVQPLINWLNEQLDWRLTLHPFWRPAFVLGMIGVGAKFRANWVFRKYYPAIPSRKNYYAIESIKTFVGDTIQMLVVALAFGCLFPYLVPQLYLLEPPESFDSFSARSYEPLSSGFNPAYPYAWIVLVLFGGGLALWVGAMLYPIFFDRDFAKRDALDRIHERRMRRHFPYFRKEDEEVSIQSWKRSARRKRLVDIRTVTIALGGFVTAGAILVADAALKLLS